LALVVLAFVLIALARKASHALLLIFVSFFLAVGLNAPVHWLTHRLPGKRDQRTLATAISFLIIVLLLIGFIASISPPLVRQTRNFLDAAPRLVQDTRRQDSGLGQFIRNHHLENQVQKLSDQLSGRLSNLGGSLLSTAQKIGSSLFALLTVLVLTFMMLIEGPRWIKFTKRLIPPHQHKRAEQMAYDMYRVVRGYVNGQIILAALAAALISVPLFLLHVSYPVALVVIVFICGLIPLVGHTIGAVLVSTAALFQSPWTALIILIYYITYQQLENYLIQPKIQANATNMSPLLVFSAVIIGVSLNGLLGGLLAIPVAGCIRVIVLDYLNSRSLLYPPEQQATADTK
jgi:predicted PurR-regulated permease PerM